MPKVWGDVCAVSGNVYSRFRDIVRGRDEWSKTAAVVGRSSDIHDQSTALGKRQCAGWRSRVRDEQV
jgi:hypothetical protein